MIPTILDTVTGETAVGNSAPYGWWEWGNGSCDCNRVRYFPEPDAEQEAKDVAEFGDTGIGTCMGSQRFLIVSAQLEEGEEFCDLYRLNDSYPAELLAKHGITDKGPVW